MRKPVVNAAEGAKNMVNDIIEQHGKNAVLTRAELEVMAKSNPTRYCSPQYFANRKEYKIGHGKYLFKTFVESVTEMKQSPVKESPKNTIPQVVQKNSLALYDFVMQDDYEDDNLDELLRVAI